MAPSVATVVPTQIRAGDTTVFRRSYADFPVGDGWTFAFTLAGPSKLTVAASVSSGEYAEVTLSATQTKDLLPGTYRYLLRATLSSAPHTAEAGTLTVLANEEAATAGALEDPDERLHQLLTATLEARARNDVAGYSYQGRSLDRIPLPELRAWHAEVKARIQRRRRGGKQAMGAVHFTRGGLR